MKPHYPIFCLLFVLLVSCTGSKKQQLSQEIAYPIVIPFDKGVTNKQEVTLSQMASSVAYIPLETTDESLISRISNIQTTAQYLFVQSREGLMQFTPEGRFIKRFGTIGQGPGEFQLLTQAAINEPGGMVHLLAGEKILNYSLEGAFLNEFNIQSSFQMCVVNKHTVAISIYNMTGQEKDRLILYDIKGDLLTAFAQPNQFTPEQVGMFVFTGDRPLYTFNGKACYKDKYNDTLFVVTPTRLEPRYIFQMGRYGLPAEDQPEYHPNNFFTVAPSHLRTMVMETKPYLFAIYAPWGGDEANNKKLLIYNKQTEACYSTTDNKIENDIDNGLPFFPTQTINDDTAIAVWEAADILELMEKKPSLKQINALKNLTEESNPVLMIVKLK